MQNNIAEYLPIPMAMHQRSAVFAWEIGSGFGHLTTIAEVGQALLRQHFKIAAIVPARTPGRNILEPLGFEVFDAPEHDAPLRNLPISINYAANLLRNGYWHAETVSRRLSDWRGLLDRLRPDLLISEHAPVALLASRDASYLKAAAGNGFTLPPLTRPMPSLQPWFPSTESRLAREEEKLVNVLNAALTKAGLRPLNSVAALFEGVERFLCIDPELDHYPTREHEHFLGAIESPSGLPISIIDLSNAPVFVYLSAHNRFLKPLLMALRRRDIPTLAYIANGQKLADLEPAGSSIRYLTHLVDLPEIAAHCRLAVIHGGTLSASLFLKHGVKLLICPQDLEKALLGWRIKERKLGWTLNWFSPDDNQAEAMLDRILDGPNPEALARFAHRQHDQNSGDKVASLIDRFLTHKGEITTKHHILSSIP